jgi:hypothetical protein
MLFEYSAFFIQFTNVCTHPCALVQWFHQITEERDEVTGMWMVAPSFNEDDSHDLSIIRTDSIIRSAHLLPMFGTRSVPNGVEFHNLLRRPKSIFKLGRLDTLGRQIKLIKS